MTRPPDFYVLTESGYRVPCILWGEFSEDRPHILVGKDSGSPFLIDSQQLCMVTFAGTPLDIAIEPAEPPTEAWLAMTEQADPRPDPTDRPEYPSVLANS